MNTTKTLLLSSMNRANTDLYTVQNNFQFSGTNPSTATSSPFELSFSNLPEANISAKRTLALLIKPLTVITQPDDQNS